LPERLPKVVKPKDVSAVLRTQHRKAHKHSDFESARDAALMAVLYTAGIRRDEAHLLSIGDVDLDARTLRVTGKGNKQRVAFLTPATCDLLRAYLSKWNGKDDALFLGRRDRDGSRSRISSGYIWQIVQKVAAASGVTQHLSPHMFRHSFATHLVENGAGLETVRELLGHKNLNTTQIYLTVSRSHLRRDYDVAQKRIQELVETDANNEESGGDATSS